MWADVSGEDIRAMSQPANFRSVLAIAPLLACVAILILAGPQGAAPRLNLFPADPAIRIVSGGPAGDADFAGLALARAQGPWPDVAPTDDIVTYPQTRSAILLMDGAPPFDLVTQPSEPKASRHIPLLVGRFDLAPVRDGVTAEFLGSKPGSMVLGGLVMSALLGLLALAWRRHYVQPFRAIADGVGQITYGNYAVQTNYRYPAEARRLSGEVNQLARGLAYAEETRRERVADIAHELRTPLCVLRAEIEAIQDGIRQPDTKSLSSLHANVLHLNRLIGDLHGVVRVDQAERELETEDLDIARLLRDVLDDFRGSFAVHDIELAGDISRGLLISGDRTRLRQLITNVLENSRRYTKSGGRVDVRLIYMPQTAIVMIEDSAPSPDDDQIERLFERTYSGHPDIGQGLGLAICRRIAEAPWRHDRCPSVEVRRPGY